MQDTLCPPSRLPALRIDAQGRRRVDLRAIVHLAWPLFLNTGVQAVLNLTDTWFLGRISVDALAAIGTIFFLVLVFVLFLGGVGQGVQTLVAQAFGAGQRTRAAADTWAGLYASVCTAPAFLLVAVLGHWILVPFKLDPAVQALAEEYWFPRVLGGWTAVAVWCMSGFFNGVGRTRITLVAAVAIAVTNAGLNQLLMFELGWGVAGAAWATNIAQLVGLMLLVGIFLAPDLRREFESHRLWRPPLRAIWKVFLLGIPMGAAATADLAGFTMFQLMLSRYGAVEAAASQIVMMLTTVSFMPAIGIALAGTTLVGQSIGAKDRDWAATLGNRVILLCTIYMGMVGGVLALLGSHAVRPFATGDGNVEQVTTLGAHLLWIAALYQVFDAINLGCAFCLRGAGDVKFPAAMLLVLSWFGFVPLTHMLTFAPGEGLVDFLPQFGLGATGSWIAAVVYICLLGLSLWARWQSGRWRHITLAGTH